MKAGFIAQDVFRMVFKGDIFGWGHWNSPIPTYRIASFSCRPNYLQK